MRKIILLLFGLAFFLCSSSPKTSIDEGGKYYCHGFSSTRRNLYNIYPNE